MPADLNERAQALWRRWVEVAHTEGYTPPETMVALSGGIAEMLRANIPQSTWEDHLQTVISDIRFILTGIAPTEDPHDPSPTDRRQSHQPQPPRPRRRAPRHGPRPG